MLGYVTRRLTEMVTVLLGVSVLVLVLPEERTARLERTELWSRVLCEASDATLAELVATLDQPVAAIGITDQRETVVVWGLMMFVLIRFGLFAQMVAFFFSYRLQVWPITLETSAWYAGSSFLVLGVLVALLLILTIGPNIVFIQREIADYRDLCKPYTACLESFRSQIENLPDDTTLIVFDASPRTAIAGLTAQLEDRPTLEKLIGQL